MGRRRKEALASDSVMRLMVYILNLEQLLYHETKTSTTKLAEGKMKPRDKNIGDEKPFQIRT